MRHNMRMVNEKDIFVARYILKGLSLVLGIAWYGDIKPSFTLVHEYHGMYVT